MRLLQLTARPVRLLAETLIARAPGKRAELWLYFAGFDIERLKPLPLHRASAAPSQTRPAQDRGRGV